jgi:DNA-binding HxlR family transcriptional regulator
LIINAFEGETRRYGELRRLLPEISEKMLIQELNELVRDSIIEKKDYNEIPPRVEYKLTKKGEEALPIVASLYAFGTTLSKST